MPVTNQGGRASPKSRTTFVVWKFAHFYCGRLYICQISLSCDRFYWML